jgi:hypothetical protein
MTSKKYKLVDIGNELDLEDSNDLINFKYKEES